MVAWMSILLRLALLGWMCVWAAGAADWGAEKREVGQRWQSLPGGVDEFPDTVNGWSDEDGDEDWVDGGYGLEGTPVGPQPGERMEAGVRTGSGAGIREGLFRCRAPAIP